MSSTSNAITETQADLCLVLFQVEERVSHIDGRKACLHVEDIR